MKTQFELRGLGFVWSTIERALPPEVKDAVRGLKMCEDKMVSLIFGIQKPRKEENSQDKFPLNTNYCSSLSLFGLL